VAGGGSVGRLTGLSQQFILKVGWVSEPTGGWIEKTIFGKTLVLKGFTPLILTLLTLGLRGFPPQTLTLPSP
jgi:hypothetical protein